MNDEVRITFHARVRAMERFGWGLEDLYEQALSSLEQGFLVLENSCLYEYFRWSFKKYRDSLLYLFRGAVFVWVGEKLVTVYKPEAYYHSQPV